MCQLHCLGIVCNLGLNMLLAKRCFSYGFPYIGHNQILAFALIVCHRCFWLVQKRFVAYFLIGDPFVHVGAI